MKRLKLKSLKVISTTEQTAKIINFDSTLTVITSNGENRTGKSLIIKSIYYALGADLSQYTRTWNNLSIVTLLDFQYENIDYTIFRLKNNVLLYNHSSNTYNVFKSLGDLKNYYNSFFDMKLKLSLSTNSDDKDLHIPYAQALFMPFYIDQDMGWNNMWTSFKSLNIYKDGKKEILEFYTGIKTNDYYKLMQKKTNEERLIRDIKTEQANCKLILDNNLKYFKDILSVNTNIKEFKTNIDALVYELNKVQQNKNEIKKALLNAYNRKSEIIDELNNIKLVLNDLEKDKAYMIDNVSTEIVICPICGTGHKNNNQVRYILELDIENCKNNIESLLEDLNKQEAEIKKIKRKLETTSVDEQNISKILNKKKNKIKLNDILLSTGVNSVIKDLQKKTRAIDKKLLSSETELNKIKAELKYYSKLQKEYNTNFIELLKPFLAVLGIGDIEPKKIGEKIKEGGSDQARCISAYVLAYYIMTSENRDAVLFPLVMDTPAQQEAGTKDMQTLYKLFLDKIPNDGQLIIATSDTYGMNFPGAVYTFADKRSVLNKTDFNSVQPCYLKYLSMITRAE